MPFESIFASIMFLVLVYCAIAWTVFYICLRFKVTGPDLNGDAIGGALITSLLWPISWILIGYVVALKLVQKART